MLNQARRLLPRLLLCLARRARPVLCIWLALPGASPAFSQQISAAEFTGPTSDYPHGALGDDLEWSAIRITLSRQKGNEGDLAHGFLNLTYEIKAPPQMVFEDTAPRLWDIDGDAKPEVVAVLSHQDYGAQLVAIAYRDDAFTYLATTPLIGQRFRWLAPIGAADLDGDGHIEVAFILTPHLSKNLHIWRYNDGDFTQIAQQTGLTNHQIGWDHIPGGIRTCGAKPEVITANADWTRIIASTLQNNVIQSRDIAPYTGPSSLNAALSCN